MPYCIITRQPKWVQCQCKESRHVSMSLCCAVESETSLIIGEHMTSKTRLMTEEEVCMAVCVPGCVHASKCMLDACTLFIGEA